MTGASKVTILELIADLGAIRWPKLSWMAGWVTGSPFPRLNPTRLHRAGFADPAGANGLREPRGASRIGLLQSEELLKLFGESQWRMSLVQTTYKAQPLRRHRNEVGPGHLNALGLRVWPSPLLTLSVSRLSQHLQVDRLASG